jgi:acetyl-CoA carboxylase carboxyl transferase subunit beta
MAERINVSIEHRGGPGAPGGPGAAAGGSAPGGKRHPNTCPTCGSHFREDELRASAWVCRQCGHHFPMRARDRIAWLADPNSFSESAADVRSADPLRFFDKRAYSDRIAEAEMATGLGDAIVIGSATVDTVPCELAVMDFSFIGGSMGSAVGEKFARACDAAAERKVPLISIPSSGGARMQEGILSLMQMPKTVVAIEELHAAGAPLITVITNPTTGGVVASLAMLGDITVAEPGALMSFAGPRVVSDITKEKLPEDFGRAESNYRLGHLDAVLTRPELRPYLAKVLRLFRGQ